MKELKGTKTEANLMTAFSGESQAANKYTYYASKAKKDGYVQIAALFTETAGNEREHAKIWFKLLHGGVGGTLENLKDAAAGENYEWTDMYAVFAREARRRALRKSPACSTEWPPLRRSTRNGIAVWPGTWSRTRCSSARRLWFGNAPTAVTSMWPPRRLRYAPCALIPGPILRSGRRTIEGL